MAEIKQVKIDATTYTPKKIKVDVWQASDGTQFPLKEKAKAEKYQADIDLANHKAEVRASIKTVNLDMSGFFDGESWYYAENDEQLEQIKNDLGWSATYANHYINGNKRSDINTLKVGDWITCKYESNGDYRDTYNWYTFNEVLADIMIFLETAKKAGMVKNV